MTLAAEQFGARKQGMSESEAQRNRSETHTPHLTANDNDSVSGSLDVCTEGGTNGGAKSEGSDQPVSRWISVLGRGEVEIREVPGMPGYHVTPDGDVFSSLGGRLRKLTAAYIDRDGYRRLNTRHVDGKRRIRYVHRMVAVAWIGEPPFDRAEVRHKDGDPLNNSVENLEWGSHRDNMGDRGKHGRNPVGEKNGRALVTEEQVRTIRARAAAGEWHAKIGADYGLTRAAVADIVRRRNWRHVA